LCSSERKGSKGKSGSVESTWRLCATCLIPDPRFLIPDMDKAKLAMAFACVVLGVWGYYHFSETAQVLRVLMVLGGLVAAGAVGWLSAPGKEFFAFAQEAWAEAGRVSWPTRKETLQTTGIVFAFVVIMAMFLFGVDTLLAFGIKLLTGRGE
jgi:preprotein translocase subunit SecE